MTSEPAPILVVEIMERTTASRRVGALPVRSYQARVVDYRKVPARTTEFKIHLSLHAAIEEALDRMARMI